MKGYLYLNKKCFISVKPNNNNILNFKGIVKEISKTHITFIDKFNRTMSYRLTDLVEIRKEDDKSNNENKN